MPSERSTASVRETPAASFDETYFAAHRINAYQRLLGVKGFVASRLRKQPVWPTSIFDIGCGLAYFFRDVAFIPERFGCDVSDVALRAAQVNDPNARFELISADGDLPFAGRRFDVVTCFDVIEHVADDVRLLQQARARMNPGALLVLSTPNPASLGHRRKKGAWFAYRDPTHINVMPVHELTSRLQANGFVVEDLRYDGLWDVPYFTRWKVLEQLLIQLPSVLAFRFGRIGWGFVGENAWVLARAVER